MVMANEENLNTESEVKKMETHKKNMEETNSRYSEEHRKKLEAMGVKFNGNTAILTPVIQSEPFLIIEMLWDKTGKRKYHLDEIVEGEKVCINDASSYISPCKLKQDKLGSQLEDFISERWGDYTDSVQEIISFILDIERNRLLTIDRTQCLNCDLLTTKEIFQKIQEFMLDNPLDEKIGFVNNANMKLLGIVGRGKNTAYQNFQKLIAEIAPENIPAKVKEQMILEDMFITDQNSTCNDAQKTLSKTEREKLKIRGDKIYGFNFQKKFLNQFEQVYAKALAEQKAEEEITCNGTIS